LCDNPDAVDDKEFLGKSQNFPAGSASNARLFHLAESRLDVSGMPFDPAAGVCNDEGFKA
jgi:hypothetical protein